MIAIPVCCVTAAAGCQTTTRARGEGAANATGLALAVGVRVILGGLTAG